MAAFSRGTSACGMFSCTYSRTFQVSLQSSTPLSTPLLTVFRTSQRWYTTSHVLRAQAAQREPSPEVKEAMERAQRSVRKTSDELLKWREAQQQSGQPARRSNLPKPRKFDLVGSSEAYYMSSKTKQKSLRELLPDHDTLPKSAAVERPPPSKISQAVSSVRQHIPFFGVSASDSTSSFAAKDEPESYADYDDADVHTLYVARNTRTTTTTIAILVGLVVTTSLGLISMMAFSFSQDYQPGSRPVANRYVDWVKLLQGFGLAFLTFCTIGAYRARVGLVNRVRFFPRQAAGQSKPWMRAKSTGRSKIKSNASVAEGTIEVTSRTWMPFGQRTQSFDVSELWIREPIIMQRLKWENENGPMETLRAGETLSGRKMGWIRKFGVELRDVVFKTRLVRLYGPTSSFRRAFTRDSKSWLLDLKYFNDATEREFSAVVPLKSRR